MLNSLRKWSLIMVSMLSLLSITGCGRMIIDGRVVDAQDKKPVEGAAVWIYWSKPSFGPPGLGGSVIVEIAEDLTDVQGMFQMPKYSTLTKNYRMAVYKKGYVCWSNEDIFPTFGKRTGFKLKNGLVIKLERFKEEYSKIRHASFTISSSTGCSSTGIFGKAIESEEALLLESRRKKRGK